MLPLLKGLIIGANLLTYHTSQNNVLRDVNPGAYISYHGFAVGEYLNSYSKPSWWAGYQFDMLTIGPATAGVMVGAITGYRNRTVLGNTPVVPLIYPNVRFTLPDGFGARIGVMPGTPAAVHLSVEWRY